MASLCLSTGFTGLGRRIWRISWMGRDHGDTSSLARQKLQGLLNKNMRICMTDGRTLVGLFLCTDRDCNVILGSAQEFLKSADTFSQTEPRVLGLAMIPGHHVVSIKAEADILDDAIRH
ncbi:N-alpha-acetyltransferase 38, NatC auxiliary subunit-like isoform X1 [Stigmatopora argus]